MNFSIEHQEEYSRGELLLRTFLGYFYLVLPHSFMLFFVSIGAAVLSFLSFWVILFTGEYPISWFEFQVKYIKWNTRVSASMFNMVDGYPAFGLEAEHEGVEFEVEYPTELSRVSVLVRAIFGSIFVIFPHSFCLYFRMIATGVLSMLAWWSVLFTGSYPESWHAFNVGTLRWSNKVSLYMLYMTQEYPEFSGLE
ncbi:MAG: DUF4389 domain-containing protein [Spirochaetaceae bacterium]